MAATFNPTNPVSVGMTAKVGQYRRAFDNTLALKEGGVAHDYMRLGNVGAPTPIAAEAIIRYNHSLQQIESSVNGGAFAAIAIATGTWTPASPHVTLTVNGTTNRYYKVGKLVIATFNITWPSTADGSGNRINGLPFQVGNSQAKRGSGSFGYTDLAAASAPITIANASYLEFHGVDGSWSTNAQLSGKTFIGHVLYEID